MQVVIHFTFWEKLQVCINCLKNDYLLIYFYFFTIIFILLLRSLYTQLSQKKLRSNAHPKIIKSQYLGRVPRHFINQVGKYNVSEATGRSQLEISAPSFQVTHLLPTLPTNNFCLTTKRSTSTYLPIAYSYRIYEQVCKQKIQSRFIYCFLQLLFVEQ